jgi:Leucine-rich repeat (LRR) protein
MEIIDFYIKEKLLKCNTYLDLSNMKLKEFKYMEIMKDVKYLFLNNNELTDIDVSKLTKLEVLDVSHNKLKSILYLPSSLVELCCFHNMIENIDNNNNLLKLDCSNNLLKKINIFNKLTILKCEFNKLEKIKTFNNLLKLYCNNNPINDIQPQPKLIYLNCSHTNLTKLLGGIPKIITLICNNTYIENLEENLLLEYLEISGSKIEQLEYYPKLKDFIYNYNVKLMIDNRYEISKYSQQKDYRIIEFVSVI